MVLLVQCIQKVVLGGVLFDNQLLYFDDFEITIKNMDCNDLIREVDFRNFTSSLLPYSTI